MSRADDYIIHMTDGCVLYNNGCVQSPEHQCGKHCEAYVAPAAVEGNTGPQGCQGYQGFGDVTLLQWISRKLKELNSDGFLGPNTSVEVAQDVMMLAVLRRRIVQSQGEQEVMIKELKKILWLVLQDYGGTITISAAVAAAAYPKNARLDFVIDTVNKETRITAALSSAEEKP
jgi:hypothetical protein